MSVLLSWQLGAVESDEQMLLSLQKSGHSKLLLDDALMQSV